MPNNRPETIRTIAIGSDHGGFELKEQIKSHLQKQGFQVEDCGVYQKVSVDYPLFAYKVAREVSIGAAERGIIVDGAGIGSCMAANKVPGIRAAMCYDKKSAVNSREHNNANVLTLGAGMIDLPAAREIVDIWLATVCTAERHLRRAQQILDIEAEFTDPSKKPDLNAPYLSGEAVKELSTEELSQIAVQITQILQAQGVSLPGGGCSCCGGSCCGHCAEKSSETVREFIQMGANRISYRPGGAQQIPQDLARFIDHTLLKPEASADDVRKLCEDALQFNFASVCVNPTYVSTCYEMLKGSSVKVCTVVGFPLGTHKSQVKMTETRHAVQDGAREIDMVINIGALKSGDEDLLFRDIYAVSDAAHEGGAICKVIIETALLSDEEKIIACEAARRARADFVKTSTGFSTGGATAHDIALMASVVSGSGMGVKASGGIRSYDDALKMIEAGATRIGASASVAIVQGAPAPASGGNY